MDWPLVIGVIVVVLIGGSIAAMIWWKIAAGMAPYKDESRRAGGDEVEEVVIKRTGADRRG